MKFGRVWIWVAKATSLVAGLVFAVGFLGLATLGDCITESGDVGSCSTSGLQFVSLLIFGFFATAALLPRSAPQWIAWIIYAPAALAVALAGLLGASAVGRESLVLGVLIFLVGTFAATGLIAALRNHSARRSSTGPRSGAARRRRASASRRYPIN